MNKTLSLTMNGEVGLPPVDLRAVCLVRAIDGYRGKVQVESDEVGGVLEFNSQRQCDADGRYGEDLRRDRFVFISIVASQTQVASSQQKADTCAFVFVFVMREQSTNRRARHFLGQSTKLYFTRARASLSRALI
jgi:hypothetical protein